MDAAKAVTTGESEMQGDMTYSQKPSEVHKQCLLMSI